MTTTKDEKNEAQAFVLGAFFSDATSPLENDGAFPEHCGISP